MIVFGTMADIRRTNYDELWFIENNMDWFVYEKKFSPFSKQSYYSKSHIKTDNYRFLMQPNVHVIDELALNKEFSLWVLKRKKNGLLDIPYNFANFCKKYFESIDNKDARERLNELWELDKKNKIILCVCVEKTKISQRTFLIELMKICGSNVYVSPNTPVETNDVILYDYIQQYCKNFMKQESLRD